MKLLTKPIHERLLKNRQIRLELEEDGLIKADFYPVVKLFTPDAQCTWLLTELDPTDKDTAFGLCDLGMGFPELGNVSLAELTAASGKLGLPVERDRQFRPAQTISAYAEEARELGRIRA